MNMKLYETWVQSHRAEAGDFDITDSLMERIAQNTSGPGVFQGTREQFLLDFIQAKAWVRVSVLATGFLAGLLRIVFIIYCGLFA